MSKHSLLLLALVPFCLSAANPEVKEAVESVTYSIHSKGWISHIITNITIEKAEKPNSTTYSQIINGQGLKILGCGGSCVEDGSRVSYEKDKKTKEIIVSINYALFRVASNGNSGSLTTEFFKSGTEEEKREKFNLLKALFIVKKYEASAGMTVLRRI